MLVLDLTLNQDVIFNVFLSFTEQTVSISKITVKMLKNPTIKQ
jgi:hypothetical protein